MYDKLAALGTIASVASDIGLVVGAVVVLAMAGFVGLIGVGFLKRKLTSHVLGPGLDTRYGHMSQADVDSQNRQSRIAAENGW